MSSGEATRSWTPQQPVDLRATLGLHRRGSGDPAFRYGADGSIWRAVHTPDGPGTLAIASDGSTIRGRTARHRGRATRSGWDVSLTIGIADQRTLEV